MGRSSRDRKVEKLEVELEELTDRFERRIRLAQATATEALEVAQAARDAAGEASLDADEALNGR